MLFYFSGTGNSEWVARNVANGIGETNVLAMPHCGTRYTLSPNEALGFVFPCYAWDVPRFITDFVESLDIIGVTYVYYVITCGDDTGLTSRIFSDMLNAKGWNTSVGYAVQMPESYVNLPGFDVDPDDKVFRKIMVAKERIDQVITLINDRRKGVYDTLPGRFKWLKSRVVSPFFNKFLITPKPFGVNKSCNSCGHCVSVCPFNNIKLSDLTKCPEWSDNCVLCMRCYHSCPQHSIHWGRFTKNKGQYLFSRLLRKINERSDS